LHPAAVLPEADASGSPFLLRLAVLPEADASGSPCLLRLAVFYSGSPKPTFDSPDCIIHENRKTASPDEPEEAVGFA